MKVTVRLENLGCASCAARMERRIARLEGVSACTIHFMTARMSLEGDEARMPRILEEAGEIVRRIEPRTVLRA